jgi:hypothetical protein
MSNSYKIPFYKGKLRFFQKYNNRKERRLVKESLALGEYLLPEARMTSSASYDVIDYVANPYRSPGQWTVKAARK